MITSELEEQAPFVIVHLKTLSLPFPTKPSPVIPELNAPGVVMVPLPLTKVHCPDPTVGLFPAKVVELVLQSVWGSPAFDSVGGSFIVILFPLSLPVAVGVVLTTLILYSVPANCEAGIIAEMLWLPLALDITVPILVVPVKNEPDAFDKTAVNAAVPLTKADDGEYVKLIVAAFEEELQKGPNDAFVVVIRFVAGE
jgi:hypothetical protein